MRIFRFLLALVVLALPASAFAQLHISIAVGPPELPVYDQPICPQDGDLWTPGYWAYDESISDYYWVPGTWVEAPEPGLLWTPGYWGWGDGGYYFYEGYWGENVGFYGGVNYGFGYYGEGYGGGRWDHGHFFYNTEVNHVDEASFHNVYREHIERGGNVSRVSFNGGKGGIEVHASAQQEMAAKERHIPAVAAQTQHQQTARTNPQARASVNHGRPAIAATSRPGEGADHSIPAREPGAGAKAEQDGKSAEPRVANHPSQLPEIAHPDPVNSGNAKADKKYQAQQDKLIRQQTYERQLLQDKQDAEHQKLTKQNAPDARTQQVEQKHQQQTQQLQQKHTAQQQQMQARQPQSHPANKPEKPR